MAAWVFLSKDALQREREREIEVRVASPRAFRDQRGDFDVFWACCLQFKIFFFSPSSEKEKSLVVTHLQCGVLVAGTKGTCELLVQAAQLRSSDKENGKQRNNSLSFLLHFANTAAATFLQSWTNNSTSSSFVPTAPLRL